MNIANMLSTITQFSGPSVAESRGAKATAELAPQNALEPDLVVDSEAKAFKLHDLAQQPLKLFYQTVTERIDSNPLHQAPLPFTAAYQKNQQFTAQTTAGLILEKAAAKFHNSQPTNNENSKVPAIQAAVYKGFSAAKETLESLGILSEETHDQLNQSLKLVEQGLLEFANNVD